MNRQYEWNHQSNASAQELASNHGSARPPSPILVREKPSESSLFSVLWSQNRHLWGIGDMPRDRSAFWRELSGQREVMRSTGEKSRLHSNSRRYCFF